MARELERLTLARDPRIAQVDGCMVASEDSRVRIVNTLGLDVSERANCIGALVSAIARDGERAGTGSAYRFLLDRDALDIAAIAAEAADDALDALDARPLASGTMDVVLAPFPPQACCARSAACSPPTRHKRACRCWRTGKGARSPRPA